MQERTMCMRLKSSYIAHATTVAVKENETIIPDSSGSARRKNSRHFLNQVEVKTRPNPPDLVTRSCPLSTVFVLHLCLLRVCGFCSRNFELFEIDKIFLIFFSNSPLIVCCEFLLHTWLRNLSARKVVFGRGRL